MAKIAGYLYFVLKRLIFCLIASFLHLSHYNSSAETIVLDASQNHVVLKGNNLEYYEDSSGKQSLEYIIKNSDHSIFFVPSEKSHHFQLQNPLSAVWYKINLKNNSASTQHYVLESYNYRIDTVLFYEIRNKKTDSENKEKVVSIDSTGVAYHFSQREMDHKNLTHTFWIEPDEEIFIYIKMKNRYETPVELVLRQLEYFSSYSLSEYFFLGLFYGSILIIIILNVLAGVYLKSRSHYFYVFYVFSVGVFFLCQDGMGFQYVWPNMQYLNDYAYMLSVYFMTVFMLLYTNAFLNLKNYYPLYTKLFYGYILLRTFILFITLYFFPEIRHLLYIDVLPFLMAYYCSYLSYRNKYPLSIYFLIGSTILIAGFFLNFLQLFALVDRNVYTFYIINVCFLLEMIVFYFALAERIRFYKQHKAISKGLKKAIEGNEQLIEQFTYKTSHDLSGPVKTILGVTNLALSNNQLSDQHAYMQMIRTTASRLDEILKSVAEINMIRAQEIEKTLLDSSILMEKVLNTSKIKEHSEKITVTINNHNSGFFRDDSYILYKLISNLLIYQLVCLDYEKEEALKISITINKTDYIIEASNNGKAIPEEYHKELPNIFYRLSNNNEDLGTFMHIVKLCVEKLKGELFIQNINNATCFKITIPL